MSSIKRITAVIVLALTAGCATMPDAEAPAPDRLALSRVGSFTGQEPDAALPPGWQPWILSGFKRPTRYQLVSQQGKTVMRAEAQSSASGLIHPLALDPRSYPVLQWQWKVDELISAADNTQKHLEDAPVRVVVSFAGDMEKLPVQERLFFDNIRILTGRQLPYASLMYIWENRTPVDTVIPNLHTSRIRMIVAESGSGNLGRWQDITRNIVDDYRRAFGEEPGPVTAVGIMTDTDNTGAKAQAWYGDISFRKTAPTITSVR